MLDSETRRKIDTLRDILVGKIPNPQTQVEQITTGLIYKFMDDMDKESIEMGGEGSFFVGDYEKYAWDNLLDPKLSGVEKVKLYSDAIEGMYLNPSAPQLFREMFRNAFLPFKDPSTLNMFLKEINEFHYSHSEKLGDAFEYLISIMGSQGDAGQFRTPRHIIDFIIQIIDPQKNENILDPACGTAGFLISSYKHILENNTDKNLGDQLSAQDKKKMGENITGYDISPEMVRLSLVNMYLHGFNTPKIDEYDTLSSEDKWNEYFDVILANPPFFSPKGGIQPHKRFGVDSKKAEVLFTSYILEHLKPKGRAGIIVPEGIIFQTGTAYKELRKQLIEKALVGVISLPSGIFQPYSGVKTSILILDKERNQKLDSIFFAKIENDGFSLGAQRTPTSMNDLPSVISDFYSFVENKKTNKSALVQKDEIIRQNEISFSVSRYMTSSELNNDYETVPLGEVCSFQGGSQPPKSVFVYEHTEGYDRFIQIRDFNDDKNVTFIPQSNKNKHCESDDVLIGRYGASVGRICRGLAGAYNVALIKTIPSEERLSKSYLYYLLSSKKMQDFILAMSERAAQAGVNPEHLKDYSIPLPPIEVQQQIVDELEGYQKIIDGCRQVVENYKPTIDIDPSWETVELGDLVEVKGGKRLPKGEKFSDTSTLHPYIRVSDFKDFSVDKSNLKFISDEIHEQISRYVISSDDLYISIAGTIGLVGEIPEEISGANLTENAAKLVLKTNKISKEFLVYLLATTPVQTQIQIRTHTVGVPKLALERIRTIEIPVPSIDEQNKIVKSIKHENSVVNGISSLISIYTQKIHETIIKVWGE